MNNIQELINSYRLFDINCGLLEVSERIRSELVSARYYQMSKMNSSFIERTLVLCAALIAGIPILFEFIPSDASYKSFVMVSFFCIICAYWGLSCYQWISEREDVQKLKRELNSYPNKPIEENPMFLQMLASTYGTRRSIAREIATNTSSDEATKAKFLGIQMYWESQIDELKKEVDELFRDRKISDISHRIILEWLSYSSNQQQ